MALGSTSAFRPTGTVSIAATTTSSSVALAGGGDAVVVTNTAAGLAFVRFGTDLTVTASNADMPVLGGQRVMLAIGPFVSAAAIVLQGSSGTILISRGDGSYI